MHKWLKFKRTRSNKYVNRHLYSDFVMIVDGWRFVAFNIVCIFIEGKMENITTTRTHIRRWWFYLIVCRGLKMLKMFGFFAFRNKTRIWAICKTKILLRRMCTSKNSQKKFWILPVITDGNISTNRKHYGKICIRNNLWRICGNQLAKWWP